MSYVSLNDAVYFTANFYHPVSGFSYAADATPAWYVYESGAALILNGAMTARSEATGSYWGTFDATTANGFVSQRHYDVQVSGAVGGVTRFVSVKDFVLDDIHDANVTQVNGETVDYESGIVDANLVQVSGVSITLSSAVDANLTQINGEDFTLADAVSVSGVVDSNVVQVSGEQVSISDFRADVSSLDADIYFAQIKHIQDANNDTDEFVVHWFRNDQPVSSGELTIPALSVYNTSTGVAVIEHESMYYSSLNVGTVRYDSSIILASGEPYLVETSGTISSSVRTWRSIVGIDTL